MLYPTVKSKADLVRAVEEWGIVPFFENSVAGFSLEEHCDRSVWFPDEGEGVWEWKGPVIRETGCAYGKFFGQKAAWVRADLFADLANFRRDGYDFDARYDDGLASTKDKYLYDLLAANAPILSRDLKNLGCYGKEGKKGFDTLINRLQSQCYVVIRDFLYQTDRAGKPYGWGLAQYSTPEEQFGDAFCNAVYRRTPQESYDRLLAHLRALLPDTDEARLKKFLKK